MDRLTPEEFEELFNAYNSGFTEDILNSPDRFDKLKDINKETAKAIANKRAEQLKQAGLTPNLDAFMPESYNRWYRPFDLDDRDTIMDTLNYANMLSGGKGFSKDSLEDFSKFIQKLYYTKSIKKKYSKDDLYKIYTYFSDIGLNDKVFNPAGTVIHGPREMSREYRDYRDYAQKSLQAGTTAPTFETFLEDKILRNPEVNLDYKLNTLKQLQEGFDPNLQYETLKYGLPSTNVPKTSKEEIPKENEITDTTPKVETKPIEPKKDFYSMIKDEYNQDEKVRSKYHKLGWWK